MWVLGLVIFIDQVDQNILRGVVTPLKHDLGIGDLQIGVLLTAYTIVNGVITVPAGYLADRWNRSRTIGHTIVAWSGLTALTAAMPTYGSLLAIRSALGFGQAVTEPSAASLVGDYYPQEQRGKAFSVQQCLLLAGIGVGIGVGGVVGATLGWRAAFLLVGTPGVLIAVAVYRLHEPVRGAADRLHLGLDAEEQEQGEVTHHLFEEGFRAFVRDLFFFSYLWVPFGVAFPLELLGVFITSMAIPALRAGLTDAVPANLRGAGFGFFNLASIVFGGMAPLLVFGISQATGDLRTAFLVCSPPIFAGALVLLRARDHLDEDAARIFQAILTAMQAQQEQQT